MRIFIGIKEKIKIGRRKIKSLFNWPNSQKASSNLWLPGKMPFTVALCFSLKING